MSVARRLVLAAAVTVVAATAPATAAGAHTVTGVQPTNYRSELGPIQPPIAGASMRLLDLGRRVRFTNVGRSDVVVTGYSGEPYLRIGPTGVFENVRSPTVYLNQPTPSPNSTTTLPARADATANPEWRKVATGRSVTWRDQRTRWEGVTPDSVRSDPASVHVVRTWTIFLHEGNSTSTTVARISWVPPPGAQPWLLLAAVLFGATFSVAVFSASWRTALSAALALVVANDVVHSFAAVAASGDSLSTGALRVLVGSFYGTIAWIVGVACMRGLQAGEDNSVLLAGIVGFFIALLGGATDAAGLGRSQVLFSFPASVARAEVAISLGVGLGLAAAAAWLLLGPSRPPARRSQAPARARPTPRARKRAT